MTTPNQNGQPNPPGSMQSFGTWNYIQGRGEADWKNYIQDQWDSQFNSSAIGGGTNFLIVVMLRLLASLLNMVPVVGDDLAEVVNNIADGLNGTDNKATQAIGEAAAAQSSANAAAAQVALMSGQVSEAVTQAQAAANAAAAAEEVADNAYGAATYWEAECVVASAAVVLGLNELFIGLCQNVPTGKQRIITDIHIALQHQPNGMTIETKKWNATGLASSVIRVDNLAANQTRLSIQNVDASVVDKERIFWNVTSITGSVEPLVLQILVFGVIIESD